MAAASGLPNIHCMTKADLRAMDIPRAAGASDLSRVADRARLAGVSAFLYGERGRSVGEVSWFLLTRGLWLILIEFTLMRLCWTFSFHANVFVMQVIWVTGASMVVLAGLVHLPRWAIATIGLAMIAGHNLA